ADVGAAFAGAEGLYVTGRATIRGSEAPLDVGAPGPADEGKSGAGVVGVVGATGIGASDGDPMPGASCESGESEPWAWGAECAPVCRTVATAVTAPMAAAPPRSVSAALRIGPGFLCRCGMRPPVCGVGILRVQCAAGGDPGDGTVLR